MYVQTVHFAPGSATESDYLDIADEVAPRYSSMPGLMAKAWLDKSDDGTYGAIYFWENQESMERYCRRDLLEGRNPAFSDVQSHGSAVLENLTRTTQPVLEVVQGRQHAHQS